MIVFQTYVVYILKINMNQQDTSNPINKISNEKITYFSDLKSNKTQIIITQPLKTEESTSSYLQIKNNIIQIKEQMSQQKSDRPQLSQEQNTKKNLNQEEKERDERQKNRQEKLKSRISLIENIKFQQKQQKNNNQQQNGKTKHSLIQKQEVFKVQQQLIISTNDLQYKSKNNKQKKYMKSHKAKTDTEYLDLMPHSSNDYKQKYRKYCLLQFYHYIFQVADRNDAVEADYGHFLIPYGLILKILTLYIKNKIYIHDVLEFIRKKINNNSKIQKQIKIQLLRDFWLLIVNNDKKEKDILSFLNHFLRSQKQIMSYFMPYYYNLFALAVNKQRYFNGMKLNDYLQYTVDFKHIQVSSEVQIEYEFVMNLINSMQKKLSQKYNDQNK